MGGGGRKGSAALFCMCVDTRESEGGGGRGFGTRPGSSIKEGAVSPDPSLFPQSPAAAAARKGQASGRATKKEGKQASESLPVEKEEEELEKTLLGTLLPVTSIVRKINVLERRAEANVEHDCGNYVEDFKTRMATFLSTFYSPAGAFFRFSLRSNWPHSRASVFPLLR